MARHPRTTMAKTAGEQVVVLAEGVVPSVGPEEMASDGHEIVADATAVHRSVPKADVPPPKCFRVIKGGWVLANGYRSLLREGKVVDALNYDIARLTQQGIALQEIDPAQREVSGF